MYSLQAREDRWVAFFSALRGFDLDAIRQTTNYLQQQIQSRRRAVPMVGITDVLLELQAIELQSRPTPIDCAKALWQAADYVSLYSSWPHNETTRPILLMVVREAHARQNLIDSEAFASLTSDTPHSSSSSTKPTARPSRLAWLSPFRGRTT